MLLHQFGIFRNRSRPRVLRLTILQICAAGPDIWADHRLVKRSALKARLVHQFATGAVAPKRPIVVALPRDVTVCPPVLGPVAFDFAQLALSCLVLFQDVMAFILVSGLLFRLAILHHADEEVGVSILTICGPQGATNSFGLGVLCSPADICFPTPLRFNFELCFRTREFLQFSTGTALGGSSKLIAVLGQVIRLLKLTAIFSNRQRKDLQEETQPK